MTIFPGLAYRENTLVEGCGRKVTHLMAGRKLTEKDLGTRQALQGVSPVTWFL